MRQAGSRSRPGTGRPEVRSSAITTARDGRPPSDQHQHLRARRQADRLTGSVALGRPGFDVTAGVVRGRQLGGDWGSTYTHRILSDDSEVVRYLGSFTRSSLPSQPEVRGQDSSTYVPRNTALDGIEFHKYWAFATINRRVQVGMNLAGGALVFSGGNAIKTSTRHAASGRPILLPVSATATTLTVEDLTSETETGPPASISEA